MRDRRRSLAVDLSGRWNGTDSRLVAEEIVEDVLNRSSEQIHTSTFIQSIEQRNLRL